MFLRTMRTITMLAVLPFAGLALDAHADSGGGEEEQTARLQQLFEDFFEENLDINPFLATSIGDPRYNDRLPNFLGDENIEAQERFQRRWLAQAKKIDRDLLSGQDRLSYDIFVYNREIALEGFRFPSQLIPIDQFTNLFSFFAQIGSGGSIQPFSTEKDYRDFLSRIDDMVVLAEQAVANMKLGIQQGVVQPRVLMEKTLPQFAALIVDDPAESVFFGPIRNFPEGLDEETRAELTTAYAEAIRTKIVPIYRLLHDFIRDEYLPACRETVAISDLPDGLAWYAYLVKSQTTTELTPDAIHEFGLEEVARITKQMVQVKEEVGFEGTLQEFFDYLRNDDQFYYTSEEDLVAGYVALRDRINAVLPKAFDIFPKSEYEIKPVPDFMAESSAAAFYQPGSPDGSRPGVFYVNTFNLKAQPKFGMETLSIHEAAPGHHFQISIAMEIEALPKFRRFGGTNAYFEGWALYSESLGKELGLFTDPYQWYGRLDDEMLRAMRLVVDTGLHSRNWSREKAIQYMIDHSSMAESDAIAEVERYIAIPGQALGYKVGQRIISGLRATAEEALGKEFDIKAFHRAILIDGALPLGVLDQKMAEWLAEQTERS